MIEKKYHFPDFEPDFKYLKDFPKEEILFFDIETTGFSPRTSSLYLIGASCFQDEHWTFLQWFAESPKEEAEILSAFLTFCRSFSVLVHFNGEGFDLPYLLLKAEKYQLPDTLSSMVSLDIYRKIRPYRSALKLTSIKQKNLEIFCGIHRDDRYSGGELIKIYQAYCKKEDADARALLLLHNLDDLKGMTKLLPLLSYPSFFEKHSYVLSDLSWQDDNNGQPLLIITLELEESVPTPLSLKLDLAYLTIKNHTAKLLIHAFEGELKYYIPDYKNYYYIPEQDCAMHKQIASFTDPAQRIPAKASTCYQRHTGLFLPQSEAVFSPVFQSAYRSNNLWFECTTSFMNHASQLSLYIKSLISI